MAQITTGLRSFLSLPIFYDFLQRLLGANRVRKELASKYLKIIDGEHVLDIGCGTAEILNFLPCNIKYIGFDASDRYIKTAKSRYERKNICFSCNIVASSSFDIGTTFDVIIATGVLHHLDDEEVAQLFSLAKSYLKRGGRLVTIDPCLLNNQRRISKYLVSRDRGQNVRTPNEYSYLAKEVFTNVNMDIRNNLLYVPYDHVVLECTF